MAFRASDSLSARSYSSKRVQSFFSSHATFPLARIPA